MTETRAETVDLRTTRAELVRFFVAAFAASWLLGGLAFFVLDLGVSGLALGTAALTGVALVLTWRAEGTVRPLLRQVLRWRVGLGWYAAAFAVPLLALGFVLVAGALLGTEVLAPEPVGIGLALLLLPMNFAVGGLEEPGWRGYALPRLQRIWPALTATLVLGAIWMLWHVPLFVVANPMFESIPFGAYVVVGVSSAVTYTWLYNSTGGSVLLVMLLHAVKNTTLGYLAPTLTAWMIFAAAWVLIAGLLVAAFGWRDLASRPRHVGYTDGTERQERTRVR